MFFKITVSLSHLPNTATFSKRCQPVILAQMDSDKYIISIPWKLNLSTTTLPCGIFQLGFYNFKILPEISHVPLFWVAELILFYLMFCNMMREESNCYFNITNSTAGIILMWIMKGKCYLIGTIWENVISMENFQPEKKNVQNIESNAKLHENERICYSEYFLHKSQCCGMIIYQDMTIQTFWTCFEVQIPFISVFKREKHLQRLFPLALLEMRAAKAFIPSESLIG